MSTHDHPEADADPSRVILDDEIGPHPLLYQRDNEHAWLQSSIAVPLEVYR